MQVRTEVADGDFLHGQNHCLVTIEHGLTSVYEEMEDGATEMYDQFDDGEQTVESNLQ